MLKNSQAFYFFLNLHNLIEIMKCEWITTELSEYAVRTSNGNKLRKMKFKVGDHQNKVRINDQEKERLLQDKDNELKNIIEKKDITTLKSLQFNLNKINKLELSDEGETITELPGRDKEE